MKLLINAVKVVVVMLTVTSCVAVQPYEFVYLNDEEMDLGVASTKSSEIAFQAYREGATGANGGKVGGGCGCN